MIRRGLLHMFSATWHIQLPVASTSLIVSRSNRTVDQGDQDAKEEALMLPLRLVIDTNVLVSAAL